MSEALIGAIVGALVLFGGAIVKWVMDLRSAKHKENMESNTQALELYKSMVDTFSKKLKEVEEDVDKLNASYIGCREECAELRSENKWLKTNNNST